MSNDLKERFRALDDLHFPHPQHAPDARGTGGLSTADLGPSSGRRLGIVVFALVVATLAFVFAFRTFRSPTPGQPRPASDLGGGMIAYTAYSPHGWILRTVHPDGTSDQPISADLPHDAFHPSWSPDGTQIVFDAGPPGNKDMYTVNVDGSNLTRLTSAGGWDYLPTWSPDGSKIAYVHTSGQNDDIWVMDADGSNPVRLTADPELDLYPAWSPDSTKLVFQSNRAANSEIYVMKADGSDVSRLTTSPAFDGAPAWSPDGREIAFSSTRNSSGIFVMNVDGTEVRKLVDSSPVGPLLPSWSPDGLHIAFTGSPPGGSATQTGIYVLDLTSGMTGTVVGPGNLCCVSWGSQGATPTSPG